MTVIAWNGKQIAADKMASSYGSIQTVTKLFRRSIDGEPVVLGFTGTFCVGHALIDWYLAGAKKSDYPEAQRTKEWTRLLVARGGKLFVYEKEPIALVYEDEFQAFGSGRDYAVGAMAAGADPLRAVEITAQHSDSCGCGVDWFDL